MKDCLQIIGIKRENAQETIICRQEGKRIKIDNCLKCKICTEYKNYWNK